MLEHTKVRDEALKVAVNYFKSIGEGDKKTLKEKK
jgi:hypothetical protein